MYTDIAKSDYGYHGRARTQTFRLPSTAQLLTQGGDSRVLINADGVNQYGCSPYPDAELLAFGSSTASVISEHAFTAADMLRKKLVLALKEEAPELVYAHELNRIQHEFISLCGLHTVKNLQVVWGASGTDLHLICAQLAHGHNTQPGLVIMPDSTETGSGVLHALSARHFSHQSALGASIKPGDKINGSQTLEVVCLAMREPDGRLREAACIDAEVHGLVEQAVQNAQKVLLILVDTSKTGLISPSIDCAIQMKKRYPDNVDVLVDACQFRISNLTLQAYLAEQFMVIVTGSKFITGPIFSAALLLPQAVAKRLLCHPLPAGIADYSTLAEWPESCIASNSLHDKTNFGLLLRWEAALAELRPFKSLSEKQVLMITQRFASAVKQALSSKQNMALIPSRALNRSALFSQYGESALESWDNYPTIFSLLLYRTDASGASTPLTHAETMEIYKKLHANMRCQVGQPVICGKFNGQAISALRLCLSARLIVEASRNHGKNIDLVINKAFSVIDNITKLLTNAGYVQA